MELKQDAAIRKNFIFLLLIFAAGYLLSSLLRGVTAALAPVFIEAFHISTTQLGLLAGAYFVSFAILQLPMGFGLDRYGVRRVLFVALSIAGLSCLLFASASTYLGLFLARLLCGIGVSACLIAPLTAARLWTTPSQQQSINSWMLMAGALGLILGTLPAERVAFSLGWRTLFVGLGILFFLVALCIARYVPKKNTPQNIANHATQPRFFASYLPIIQRPYTWRIGALGFFNYAILVAVQTLWAGPWLTHVIGLSTHHAATQLLYINSIMLIVFLIMGYVSPKFNRSADDAEKILAKTLPLSMVLIALIAYLAQQATWHFFAMYCVLAWPLSVTHPLVGQKFSINEAGRAIAFYNLLLFSGVFLWQWWFGALVTYLSAVYGVSMAYQMSMGILALLSLLGYLIFMTRHKEESR